MDSTRIDSVNPAEDPSLEIQDKKDQLRAVARSVDPLSSSAKRPYVTISVAAALGVMAGAPEVAGSAQKAVSGGILKMFTGVAMQFARGWVAAHTAQTSGDAATENQPPPESAVIAKPLPVAWARESDSIWMERWQNRTKPSSKDRRRRGCGRDRPHQRKRHPHTGGAGGAAGVHHVSIPSSIGR